jgi:hypothetical protein
LEIGDLGGKNAVSSHGRNYCEFSPSASKCTAPFCPSVAQSVISKPRGRRPSTEERERDRHIDLTHTVSLAYRICSMPITEPRHDLVKPTMASGNRTERFELSELREGGSTC